MAWENPRRAEILREQGVQVAEREPAAPPEPTGQLLVALPRQTRGGPAAELRVSLDEYQNHPFISIRVWEQGRDGGWWPVKGKGVSVRLSEGREVAKAIAAAVLEAAADDGPAPAARGRGAAPQSRKAAPPARGEWQKDRDPKVPKPTGPPSETDAY